MAFEINKVQLGQDNSELRLSLPRSGRVQAVGAPCSQPIVHMPEQGYFESFAEPGMPRTILTSLDTARPEFAENAYL